MRLKRFESASSRLPPPVEIPGPEAAQGAEGRSGRSRAQTAEAREASPSDLLGATGRTPSQPMGGSRSQEPASYRCHPHEDVESADILFGWPHDRRHTLGYNAGGRSKPSQCRSASASCGRVAVLIETYDDLRLGTVDACVIATAERLGATRIATLNLRHFTIVRPAHIDAFELFP
jgi:hypothetical protein